MAAFVITLCCRHLEVLSGAAMCSGCGGTLALKIKALLQRAST